MNRGQKICLRLRYPGDKNQFLPIEQVVDTMLHELSHNVIGPHNAEFHALWDQLRREHEALISKGYTGEGFLSDGKKLGGRNVPPSEARRLARAVAEKRRTLTAGSGQKLGGRPVAAGSDIRQVIINAIEKRSIITKGCGSENKTDKEIIDLTNEATNNGFATKAEEDQANDRAIAEAMWDLVQEDERVKARERGETYTPPSAANPTGNQSSPRKTSSASKPAPSRDPSRPISRLATEPPTKKPKSLPVMKKETKKESETFLPLPREKAAPSPALTGWTCPICTLHNPIDYLACDACTNERPEEITKGIADEARKKASEFQKQTRTWQCQKCSTIMEDKWWTCGSCGTMKQAS